MFSGAQIVATKLVLSHKQKQSVDDDRENKPTKDLTSVTASVPKTEAAIVAESEEEKLARKTLAKQRHREKVEEQPKLVHHMTNLAEQVLQDKTLSKTEKDKLRNRMSTVIARAKKQANKTSATVGDPYALESSSLSSASSIASRDKSASVTQANTESKPLKKGNQRGAHLWYDKNIS